MSAQRATRRQFLKRTGLSVASVSVLVEEGRGKSLQQYLEEISPDLEPRDVIAALGDTLIPTYEPDYLGYRRLEKYGITEEVLKGLKGVGILLNVMQKVCLFLQIKNIKSLTLIRVMLLRVGI